MPHALLVDDDVNFILGLAEVVGREGFTTKTAHALKEARIELGKAIPDVVLVDLDVPGTNGFEVTRQMKASTNPAVSRIPIAAVSANVMADERSAALAAGCVAFVEKPFDIHRLRALVAELAGRVPV